MAHGSRGALHGGLDGRADRGGGRHHVGGRLVCGRHVGRKLLQGGRSGARLLGQAFGMLRLLLGVKAIRADPALLALLVILQRRLLRPEHQHAPQSARCILALTT